MGQRLVVSIVNNEKTIAAIYYHWCAYTVPAINEVERIVNCLQDIDSKDDTEIICGLIAFCEGNGGGVTSNGIDCLYAQRNFCHHKIKTENCDRDRGIIALSEQQIKGFEYWAEGTVTIYVDDGHVEFDVFGSYDDYDEYCEETEDEYRISREDIPKVGKDISTFSFDDICEIHNLIHEHECEGIVDYNGYILTYVQ